MRKNALEANIHHVFTANDDRLTAQLVSTYDLTNPSSEEIRTQLLLPMSQVLPEALSLEIAGKERAPDDAVIIQRTDDNIFFVGDSIESPESRLGPAPMVYLYEVETGGASQQGERIEVSAGYDTLIFTEALPYYEQSSYRNLLTITKEAAPGKAIITLIGPGEVRVADALLAPLRELTLTQYCQEAFPDEMAHPVCGTVFPRLLHRQIEQLKESRFTRQFIARQAADVLGDMQHMLDKNDRSGLIGNTGDLLVLVYDVRIGAGETITATASLTPRADRTTSFFTDALSFIHQSVCSGYLKDKGEYQVEIFSGKASPYTSIDIDIDYHRISQGKEYGVYTRSLSEMQTDSFHLELYHPALRFLYQVLYVLLQIYTWITILSIPIAGSFAAYVFYRPLIPRA